MSVIGILGLKRSGKDTSAEYLINNYGYVRYSFADPLKRATKEIFGFTDEQLWGDEKETIDSNWGISAREILQIMGTELFQYDIHKHTDKLSHIGRNIWVNRFKIWYKDELKKNPNLMVVIPDVRFPHEVDIIKSIGGSIWKVVRPSLNNVDLHPSETEMESIIPDLLINNDSTIENLYKTIENECTKFV
jgi:dephospho-CoA kinase